MKLILAIVNNDDTPIISEQLTSAGFNMTKIASTGGFLMSGNTTFITGVEDDKVDDVVDIISKYGKKRTQPYVARGGAMMGEGVSVLHNIPVGGGTIFVLNVERFERV